MGFFLSKKEAIKIKMEALPYKIWVGMPEFKQEKVQIFSEVLIRFRTEEDLKKFSELIGQNLLVKNAKRYLKNIWFPKLKWRQNKNKRYIDES